MMVYEIQDSEGKTHKIRKIEYLRILLNDAYVWLASCFNYNFKSYRYRNSIFSRTNMYILIIGMKTNIQF